MKIKIIAIDPGTTESAFVVWDGKKVSEADKKSNSLILETIRLGAADDYDLVIEKIASYGMAVGAETFETVFWSGRFAEAWASRTKKPFFRITRLEVKLHLCKSPRATDSNVRQAVIDRLGAPGSKSKPGPTYGMTGDLWQALAVALVKWDRMTGNIAGT